jgi:hypothetical protein
VRASGDVDQILFRIRIERIGTSKFEKCLVDPLKVPRITKFDFVEAYRCFRRDGSNIFDKKLSERFVAEPVKKYISLSYKIGQCPI